MSRKTLLTILQIGFVALTNLLMPLPGIAQPTGDVKTQHQSNRSIRTIHNLFNNYYDGLDDGTESAENKAAMRNALQSLPAYLKDVDLLLLVNVWMYYDPTDFPTRELLMPVFLQHREGSLAAVTRRLAHKKKYECRDKPPFLDLVELQKQLKQ